MHTLCEIPIPPWSTCYAYPLLFLMSVRSHELLTAQYDYPLRSLMITYFSTIGIYQNWSDGEDKNTGKCVCSPEGGV